MYNEFGETNFQLSAPSRAGGNLVRVLLLGIDGADDKLGLLLSRHIGHPIQGCLFQYALASIGGSISSFAVRA